MIASLRRLLFSFIILESAVSARAYVVQTSERWPEGNLNIQLKLGSTQTYSDGTNPNTTASEALKIWNSFMARLQLVATVSDAGAGKDENSANECFFSDNVYGSAFGADVLAVTLITTRDTRRTEADVLVNRAEKWDAYRGTLKSNPTDLRRVLVHEFGHVIGLNHPDQAGQYITSIMNAYVGNVETPTEDDQEGAGFLYGHGLANPARAPTVATAPLSTSVTEGESAGFAISVNGSAPFSYQWKKEEDIIPGANAASFILDTTRISDSGIYSVVVKNEAGSITASAKLTVAAAIAPSFYASEPSVKQIYLGASLDLSYSFQEGSRPTTFQWKRNGAPIAGANRSNYSLARTSASDAGSYTLTATNRAGSATSTTIAVVIVPVPAPITVRISMYNTGVLQVGTSLRSDAGPYTYQWMRNGLVLMAETGQTHTLTTSEKTDSAEYLVVVSNAAGATPSHAFSYTPPLAPPSAATGGWVASGAHGDLAYFLYPNPARLERYDLGAGKWLASISLSLTPTAFCVTDTALFVGLGRSVARLNSDGTGETTLFSTEDPVAGLFVRNGLLYAFAPSTYVYSKFTCFRLSDSTTVGTASYIYGMTKPGSLSVASGLGQIFGRDSGLSPPDIHQIVLNTDGTFGAEINSPYHGAYTDADRTFVSPDESMVVEDSGIVYHTSGLTYVGSLGGAVDDIGFTSEGNIVALRGASVTVYDAKLSEIGRIGLAAPATRLFVKGTTAVVFSPPAGSGTTATATAISLAAIAGRSSWPTVAPNGVSYRPAEVLLGKNNIIYLLSRAHGNVFRWSVESSRYLESLPLTGAANFLAYSSSTDTLYAGYADRRISRLPLATNGREEAFYSAASDILGLSTAGAYVFLNDSTSPWTSYYTFKADGTLISQAAWSNFSAAFVWSESNRRLYHFRDDTSPNDLLYTEILANGSLGVTKDSPYHGDISTRYPIRVSPNGGTVLIGSGVFYDGETLAKNNALPVSIDDAAWVDQRLFTARNTLDGVRVERWGGANYGRDAVGLVPGTLLRLFALSDQRLVAVVMRNQQPAFVLLDSDLNGSVPPPPTISVSPTSVVTHFGADLSLSVQADGVGLTYQWARDGTPVSDAHSPTLHIHSVTAADLGVYSVTVSNSGGTITSASASVSLESFAWAGSYFGSFGHAGSGGRFALVVRNDGSAILIGEVGSTGRAMVAANLKVESNGTFVTGSPANAISAAATEDSQFYTGVITGALAGGNLSLAIPALNLATNATRTTDNAVYSNRVGLYQAVPIGQSYGEVFVIVGYDGQALVVQTDVNETRSASGLADTNGSVSATSGNITYSGSISNGGFQGSVSMGSGTPISLAAPSPVSGLQRLINISSRARAGTGDKTMIAGFVISGDAPKEVLIRAIGPALTSLGVGGVLPNPKLTLMQNGKAIGENDDWGSAGPSVAATALRLGGFALPAGSRDAALLATLSPGAYSVLVDTNGAASGVTIIEVYDAGTTARTDPKVVNISTRADVGAGDDVLIGGFVVAGNAPKKILLRALGPTLASAGVTGCLADPKIKLYRDSTVLKENDNWGDGADAALISTAQVKVGAFPMAVGGKDAAELIYLQPGVYSVHVASANPSVGGIALVEVYEVTD